MSAESPSPSASSAIPEPPPSFPVRPPSRPPPAVSNKKKAKQIDPAQLIAMYEAEGLSPTVAAHQAILDLQKVLSKVISQAKASPGRRNEIFKADMNKRLSILEMKVDSKPGMAQVFGLQLTASAIVQAAPHVFRAFGNIWTTIRNAPKQ